ncbi:MAG: Hsp70 family protein [Pseudanabaenaceae cyanobacterium bins.39]|nr:Hsp70 family protein [Pseudanabaenaceae cyanobacterium bins.39]
MRAIAIDFGSSNTVIARWNLVTNQAETIKFADISRPEPLDSLIPSLLYVQDAAAGVVEIGQTVIDRGLDRPTLSNHRLFNKMKRRILSRLHFSPRLDGVKVSAEWAGSHFLGRLLQNLRSLQIFPDEIILSVPVDAYETYLRWLEQCSTDILMANLPTLSSPRVRIIDEPTAAALGYGAISPSALILVMDFGGGTLDLALVRLPDNEQFTNWGSGLSSNTKLQELAENKAEVIAKTGYSLGGEDIDQWLLEDCLNRYFAENNANLEVLKQNALLKLLMEKIKICLSEQECATEIFFDMHTSMAVEISYTRQQLEYLLEKKGFYRILQLSMNELGSIAFNKGVLKGDINHILLVGGSSLIPSVKAAVANNWPMAKMHSHLPFEAIAHGALLLSHGMAVQDYLFHSYAIRYRDRHSEQWKYQTIFRRGQNYPTSRPVELLLRASQVNQREISLTIGEISHVSQGTEISFDGDRVVMEFDQNPQEQFFPLQTDSEGQAIAQAIAHLVPLGQPDQDRLKVLFKISQQRELLITVIDLLNNLYLLREYPVAKLT